jgi:predicted transcriptional regulator
LPEDITPSERELDILKVLWDLGSGTVRQVHECLCPRGELAFNTVQTMLRIMEDKGLVEHRAEGRAFIYSPCHSRERVATRFLNKVFDGALDQFVLSILASKEGPSSSQELKELERLIARTRREREGEQREGK